VLKAFPKYGCLRVRKLYRLTQAELARVLRLSTQSVYYWEAKHCDPDPLRQRILLTLLNRHRPGNWKLLRRVLMQSAWTQDDMKALHILLTALYEE
jgi:transcriptional regulator with XRE-family HTH domain